MRDHRKLRAFELADELALGTYRGTKNFPPDEQFGLTSQMRRAAVSIASNIVEGCGRRSEADYLRFLEMAHASARELNYQLSLAARLGYLTEDSSRSLQSFGRRNLQSSRWFNSVALASTRLIWRSKRLVLITHASSLKPVPCRNA
jgi:four helix bundle protein